MGTNKLALELVTIVDNIYNMHRLVLVIARYEMVANIPPKSEGTSKVITIKALFLTRVTYSRWMIKKILFMAYADF